MQNRRKYGEKEAKNKYIKVASATTEKPQQKSLKGMTDGPTNGPTDGQTDEPMR